MYYANHVGESWTTPFLVDTQPAPVQPRFSEHPTIAFTPTGDLLTAWIDGSCAVTQAGTCYTPDGTVYTRVRQAGGAWLTSAKSP